MIVRRLAGVAAAVALAWSVVPAASGQAPQRPSLEGADAAILVDAGDGTPILEKEPTQRRSIASTTKLMTALLTLERAPLDAVYAAADYQAAPAESKIDLRPGERMRVSDLLEALMLESANDAAATLAEGVSGSREAFVAEMNARAGELGLEDTSYANPIGLDDPQNYSSARDLATLARRLLRDRRFARIVDSPSATLESGAEPRVVGNRNDLIASVPAVDGIKTGYTSEAGYVLVGSATGSNGAQVVSVVLGEPSEAARDADTLALLRYGLAQYRRVPLLRKGRAVARADVAHHDETVALVPRRALAVTARRDQRLEQRVRAPEELAGEIAAGTPVGTVVVRRDGEVVERVALLTAKRVPGAGPLRRVVASLGPPLTALALLVIVSVTGAVGMQMRRRHRHRRAATRRRERERVRARDQQDPAGKP
ncbi:MAG TPA: D-alanyl-D-alanine carboxypeptidase family protein [Thermoleophilaceae bacterium]|nr:D-alanyl-D-alanine carboxypeptidase family protein [Thermoleophilaceae bacterium]